MKKAAIFAVCGLLAALTIGASVSAYDPCSRNWGFVKPFMTYTAVRSTITPGAYTVQHVHGTRCYIYSRTTGSESYSDTETGVGIVTAQTNSLTDNFAPFYGQAWFSCPLS